MMVGANVSFESRNTSKTSAVLKSYSSMHFNPPDALARAHGFALSHDAPTVQLLVVHECVSRGRLPLRGVCFVRVRFLKNPGRSTPWRWPNNDSEL